MDVAIESAGAGVLSVSDWSGELFHELGGNFASIVEDSTIEVDRLDWGLVSSSSKLDLQVSYNTCWNSDLGSMTPWLRTTFLLLYFLFYSSVERGEPLISGVRWPYCVPLSY